MKKKRVRLADDSGRSLKRFSLEEKIKIVKIKQEKKKGKSKETSLRSRQVILV